MPVNSHGTPAFEDCMFPKKINSMRYFWSECLLSGDPSMRHISMLCVTLAILQALTILGRILATLCAIGSGGASTKPTGAARGYTSLLRLPVLFLVLRWLPR